MKVVRNAMGDGIACPSTIPACRPGEGARRSTTPTTTAAAATTTTTPTTPTTTATPAPTTQRCAVCNWRRGVRHLAAITTTTATTITEMTTTATTTTTTAPTFTTMTTTTTTTTTVKDMAVTLVARDMTAAATKLLNSLNGGQRSTMMFPFDSPKRLIGDGSPLAYSDTSKDGLQVKNMGDASKDLAKTLLFTGLSKRGQVHVMLSARGHNMNNWGEFNNYVFAVFGDPRAGSGATWGWRYEGWHVSIQFTVVPAKDAVLLASLPMQFGSMPMVIGDGKDGVAVVEKEGWKLINSFSAQEKRVIQESNEITIKQMPNLVKHGTDRHLPNEAGSTTIGMGYNAMSAEQRRLFLQVLATFSGLMAPAVSGARMTAVELEAALVPEQLRFAWWGPTSPDNFKVKYYMLTGPSFVAEAATSTAGCKADDPCVNTHRHISWHDTDENHGTSILLDHLLEDGDIPD